MKTRTGKLKTYPVFNSKGKQVRVTIPEKEQEPENTVRLTVDGKTQTQTFEVKKDPRLETTPEEYAKQLSLSLQVRDKLSETNEAVIRIRDVRTQVNARGARAVTSPPSGRRTVMCFGGR